MLNDQIGKLCTNQKLYCYVELILITYIDDNFWQCMQLFLDDNVKNVAAGKAVGLKTALVSQCGYIFEFHRTCTDGRLSLYVSPRDFIIGIHVQIKSLANWPLEWVIATWRFPIGVHVVPDYTLSYPTKHTSPLFTESRTKGTFFLPK